MLVMVIPAQVLFLVTFPLMSRAGSFTSVPLHMDPFSHCAFHLVHFFDVDFSESVLHSNQLGQVWTVFNVSRPSSRPRHLLRRPDSSKTVNVSLNMRESPNCNVHLLIEPDYTRAQFEDYADLLSVTTEKSRFVFLTKYQHTISVPWISRSYGIALFLLQIGAGGVVQRLWYCDPREEWLALLPGPRPAHVTRLWPGDPSCRRTLSRKQLLVIHSRFSNDTLDCLLPKRHLEFGNCDAPLNAALFIGSRLNGSVEHSGEPGAGRWASIFLANTFGSVPSNPKSVQFMLDFNGVMLLYCEHDMRRIRNEVNWLGVFDLPAWLLLIAAATLGALVRAIRVGTDLTLRLHLDPFGFLRLLQSEVSARTTFELAIAVAASVFLGCYENFVTSVTMAPNPPLVYETITDLLSSGHKMLYCDPNFNDSCWDGTLTPSELFAEDFARFGIHDANASTLSVSYAHFMHPRMRRGHVRLIYESWRYLDQRYHQYHTPEALCHVVEQRLGAMLRLSLLYGPVKGVMVGLMQMLLESGIFFWWERMEIFDTELVNEFEFRSLGCPQPQFQDNSLERPVTLDFEVMRIFLICGCLLALAASVFLLELAYLFWNAWRSIIEGLFGW